MYATSGCKLLAQEIIKQAILDWRTYHKKLAVLEKKSTEWKKNLANQYDRKKFYLIRGISDIERFFYSKAFSIFADIEPDDVMKVLKDEQKRIKGNRRK